MNKFDLGTLEFPAYIQKLKNSAVSSFSGGRIGEITPRSSVKEALEFQNDLRAVLEFLSRFSGFSVSNDHTFYVLYQRIQSEESPHMNLEPDDYLALMDFINRVSALKKELEARKSALERLMPYVTGMRPDLGLAADIERIFDRDGSIRDGASPELRQIRRRITETRQRINHLLKDVFNSASADKYIQEKVVVLRNGRYTIACKTNFAQYINAIIHDRSSSGQTVYVEPTSVVSINNDMQSSIIAEHQEIARILADLLAAFKAGLPELENTVVNYTELMFRLELGLFFGRYDIAFPEFGNSITLVDVHHPLLLINKQKDSVPINISYGEGERLIVVSGPNTGGKTVSIKTMGLSHIIAQCGLPVFARRADMIFFDSIYADIGDKQSLVMDLSTFSSHMSNICGILSSVTGKSLVLFDELGTGTDPKEGAALAISILDYLQTKGAYAMLTTHFSEIKAYAFDRADARIYAVNFDYDSFTPRYNLLEGVAGSSDPILIARRIGFPDTVLDKANELIKGYKSGRDIALEEINLMRAETEHLKRSVIEREKVLAEREARLGEKQDELKDKLSKKELELLEDTYALLQRGKRLAEERIKTNPASIAEDIQQVGEKIRELKAKRKPIEDVQPGNTIYLEKYGKYARVLSLEGKIAHIDLEGIKVKIDRSELVGHKAGEQKKEKPVKVSTDKKADVRMELVLVGKRVEEALDILDKYIDESHRAGYDKVYIVHGRGSGQLRRSVQDFLRTCGRIENYATASQEEGGDAVTVVKL